MSSSIHLTCLILCLWLLIYVYMYLNFYLIICFLLLLVLYCSLFFLSIMSYYLSHPISLIGYLLLYFYCLSRPLFLIVLFLLNLYLSRPLSFYFFCSPMFSFSSVRLSLFKLSWSPPPFLVFVECPLFLLLPLPSIYFSLSLVLSSYLFPSFKNT